MSQMVIDGGRKYFGPWNNNVMNVKTALPKILGDGHPHPIKIGAPLVHTNPKGMMRAAGFNMKALMRKMKQKKMKAGCACDMIMPAKRKKGGRTRFKIQDLGPLKGLQGGRTRLPGGKVAFY